MHSNYPLFSPEPSTADEYVMVVLTLLNNFHKTLRERQSQCLNKVRWGQPVLPGKHASFTIDRKHRGIHNPYDTDPNAATSDDEAESEEGTLPTEEAVSCGNKASDVVIKSDLPDIEQGEEAAPVCEQPNVPVYTEVPSKTVPSVSIDFLHSNQDDNQKSLTKKMKLCKKLGSNKENHKVKVHCLQRRSLFRKARKEFSDSPVLSSSDETQDIKTKQMAVSLSNNLSNGTTTTSLDMNLFQVTVPDASTVILSKDENLEQKSEQIQQKSLSNAFPDGITLLDTSTAELLEENPIPCDPTTRIALCPVSKDFPSIDTSFSSPRTPDIENEKGSPLHETDPSSNSCEIRSSSPIFSAYESPFKHSEFVSNLEDNSATKSEESAVGSVGCSVTNPEETSSEHHSEPYSKLSESEGEDFVEELPKKSKRLKKMVVSKKLKKQQALVQCPLCCEWFKPKVIETHAANCGLNTPIQPDEPVNLVDLISVPNENEVEKEMCDLNRPSENEDSNPDPRKNSDIMCEEESVETTAAVQNVECPPTLICNNNSKEPTEQLSTSLIILDPVEEKSASEDRTTTGQQQNQTETVCFPPEIQTEAANSDSVPILKRCFICDLSYVDGKPFSTHLRLCRKNYQKLKRQFSCLSDDNEEPQRKTRSRSST